MELDENEIISAQVILRPASGKEIDQNTLITSENIQDYQPSESSVAKVSQKFAQAGFEVGPVLGTGFSITAPVRTFMRVFNTQLRKGDHGEVEAKREDGSWDPELPLGSLSQDIADLLIAVTFSPPPDFGPTNFFGS